MSGKIQVCSNRKKKPNLEASQLTQRSIKRPTRIIPIPPKLHRPLEFGNVDSFRLPSHQCPSAKHRIHWIRSTASHLIMHARPLPLVHSSQHRPRRHRACNKPRSMFEARLRRHDLLMRRHHPRLIYYEMGIFRCRISRRPRRLRHREQDQHSGEFGSEAEGGDVTGGEECEGVKGGAVSCESSHELVGDDLEVWTGCNGLMMIGS
jgi:hypothetical protein